MKKRETWEKQKKVKAKRWSGEEEIWKKREAKWKRKNYFKREEREKRRVKTK